MIVTRGLGFPGGLIVSFGLGQIVITFSPLRHIMFDIRVTPELVYEVTV